LIQTSSIVTDGDTTLLDARQPLDSGIAAARNAAAASDPRASWRKRYR
jgi:hypothetical protein